jgi:hypothetical protein
MPKPGKGRPMNRDPKRLEHPKSVYLINLMVVFITLFVLGGVVNHLAFSSHGPGLLIPLVKKFQAKESPILKEFKQHRTAEEHQHFHHIVDYPELPEAQQPTCYICHSKLPHSKTKKIRAMLNMHTNYIACETCHLDIKEKDSVEYQWYSTLEKNPAGPFFGTSYDPETGELRQVKDHFSKIAPFYKRGEELEPTLHMQQGEMARDYVSVRDKLTPEQREGVTKKFHADIRPKGPECQTCHASAGILDLKKLEFSEKRIIDLENLSIKGMITKYDEFYLPDLFKSSEDTGPNDQDRK